MRKIALGRLRYPPDVFYLMTMAELYDAITGATEHERNQLQWHLWGIRKAIYFQVNYANGAKDHVKEEDIFSLEMDEELKRQRFANMKEITITEHGTGE